MSMRQGRKKSFQEEEKKDGQSGMDLPQLLKLIDSISKMQPLEKKKELWPHLPKQLLRQIELDSSLFPLIAHKGVTKSWKPSSSSTSSPKSSLHLLDHDSDDQRYLFNLGFKEVEEDPESNRYRMPRKLKFVFSQADSGRLLHVGPPLLGEHTSHRAWCPVTGGFSCIPPWDPSNPFLGLYSPPDHHSREEEKHINVFMVLTGVSRPALAFYRSKKDDRGDPEQWTSKLNCTITDPHGGAADSSASAREMRFTNGIWFREKFYALSLQGTLAVVEEEAGSRNLQITASSKTRAVPSVPCRRFRECLIESGGEVLLIFLVFKKSSTGTNVVADVEVYRLDTEELAWVRKNDLGDTTVFWGTNCCMPVSASQIGCKKNCVYFTQPSSVEEWWVYDMGAGTISPGWNIRKGKSVPRSPVWPRPK
ncbi:hypothetical protein Tsubulata_002897 [Turnera subulata]|uniref:KIB1-4 beta-propeller domain-containing protein n=1 Tax=Turnera subulata TaxID=218843 RepID=A0A9Q0G4M3_9ROSI|nr:hypothetical protein Tsubulata_002897 [Turnera subulata]